MNIYVVLQCTVLHLLELQRYLNLNPYIDNITFKGTIIKYEIRRNVTHWLIDLIKNAVPEIPFKWYFF